MEMKGEHLIAADKQHVWDGLNDPEILRACIPGCQSLDKTSDTEFTAIVVMKIGPVKIKFVGDVKLENLNPPESYSIVGEGKGGIAGFAKGGANVSLATEGDKTKLTYQVEAKIGGKIAQLGSRLIDSTAKKLANKFFTSFSELVGSQTDNAKDP